MFTATATIDIDRPPDAVFATLVDPRSWPRWVTDVKRIDAPSPMKKGDAFEETTVFRGDERLCRGEVVELEQGRLFVLRLVKVMSGPELLPTRRFALSDVGGRTRLVWTNDVEVRGLARALGPVLPAIFRSKMGGYLEALKRVVESGG